MNKEELKNIIDESLCHFKNGSLHHTKNDLINHIMNHVELYKSKSRVFILTQQLLNGTVTMDIWTKGIIADNFENAVKKLKESLLERIIIHHDDSESFHFSVPQNEDTPFEVYGILNNKSLELV